MTQSEQRCLTCHWWFRFDKSKLVGDCVWHNGTQNTVAAKVKFRGLMKTKADFGCVCWEENQRVSVDSGEVIG